MARLIYHRAKELLVWKNRLDFGKRPKAQLNSESELSDIEEEFPESCMEDSEDISDPDYEITDEEDANPVQDTRPVKPTKIEVDYAESVTPIGS
ncbi:Hypothetical predicted protein [Pelobates cultripes]|uniref:Uncharacterized protein n=1 Tax=Pelobates cultripes TaxID=61616 RepID=A0AAD1SQA5_PELCU|nr:Hypothetical predicted protein [Pelobates cultripes]